MRRGLGLSVFVLFACTDTQLVRLKPSDDRIALEAEACTGTAVDTLSEVRVLFLTDSSSSMRFNDPNDLLVEALDHVTQRHAATPNIAFAVIRWGSRRVVKENLDYEPVGTDPPLFTNDPVKLKEIFTRMKQPATVNPDKYLDGTDYEMALRAATDYLVADIAKRPGQTATTRYIIQFVTDGIPQSATNDPLQTRQNIVASVANLHQRYGARVDVSSIALAMVLPPEFIGLLPEMALAGGGQYTQLSAPQGLDQTFDRALANRSFLIEYELAGYFAFNRNLRVGEYNGELGVRVDSDGDGLVDELEESLGTDPTRSDTDDDLLSDLFEYLLRGQYDPKAKDTGDRGTDGNKDSDNDGLTNFEEKRLGTNPDSPDTDRDGIPDELELIFGLDPNAHDSQSDADQDHVAAATEVRQNLAPNVKEDLDLRERLAYRFMPADNPVRFDDGVRCYALAVENISLGQTKAGVDKEGHPRPAGLNTIELIAIERPISDEQTQAWTRLAPFRQIRARRAVVLGVDGQKDPQAVQLHLRAHEFRY